MPQQRRGEARATDGTMTLMEHLYELRRRLFYAVLAIFVGTVIGFIWYTVGIPKAGISNLGDILIAPYCSIPPAHRLVLGQDVHTCALLANTPFSILQVRIQAGILAGSILSSPVWLYQLWSFVTPALYSRERKFAITFVACAATLFAGGVVIAYLVLPKALQVLAGFGGNTAVQALSPDSYFSFLIGVLLIFGVSMELPLLLVMLNFAGVVKGVKLAQVRRYAIFGLVLFSAFVVPGNDPISMSVLAIVLAVLYECAVQVSKIHDKRKAKMAAVAGFGDVPDDEASPTPAPTPASASADSGSGHAGTSDETAGGIDTPQPIDPVEPMAPSPAEESEAPHRPTDLGDAT